MNVQKKPFNGFKAEKAVQKLLKEIMSIRTVQQWARMVRVSESTLNRLVLETYGKTAGEILKEVRYEKVLQEIERDLDACAYGIAVDSGFGSDDALRMFLRRNFDTNVTFLKDQIVSNEPRIEWKWRDIYD